jgi:ribosomal protein L37AE/L43A
MAEHDRKDNRTPQQVFQDEAAAAKRNAELVREALATAGDRCPDCGRLGSIEEVNGILTCMDCDLQILQAAQLGGLGRN